MCIICVDLIKQKMTLFEAERNAIELAWTDGLKNREKGTHYQDLFDAIHEMDLEKIERLLDENLLS